MEEMGFFMHVIIQILVISPHYAQRAVNRRQKAPVNDRGLLPVCVVKEREKWEYHLLL